MPPITPVPMACKLLAPAPVAVAIGTQPRINAIEVMTIGLIRKRAASTADSTTDMPACRLSTANSIIKMAFFADRPTSVTMPTWK